VDGQLVCPTRHHRLGGVVASGHELHEERAEVDVGHGLAVLERRLEQQGGDVVAVGLGPPLGGPLDAVHRHLDRGVALVAAGDLVVLTARLDLGPPLDAGGVLLGEAHDLGDDLGRQRPGDLVGEVELAPVPGLGEDGAAAVADLLLHAPDHPRREVGRQRLAVGGVLRRVHHQQHVAHHVEPFRVEVLEDDAAEPGGEDLGVAGDVDDIRMAEHRPVTGLAGHVLPVDRVGPPQLGERLVDRVAQVPVRVVDIDLV
jgi:hypothetical protein